MTNKTNHTFKVGQYMSQLGGGGIENYVYSILQNTSNRNIHYDLIVQIDVPTKFDDFVSRLGARKVAIFTEKNGKRFLNKIKKLGRLFKIFKDEQYDAVHIHLSLPTSLLYCVIAKKAGVRKVVAHAHSTNLNELSFFNKVTCFISKVLFEKYADVLLGDSNEACKQYYLNNSRAKSMRLGIDLEKNHYDSTIREQVRHELGLRDELVIGHIGRFVDVKNHELMLNVIRYMSKSTKVKILFVGEGDLMNYIKEKTSEFGIENNVIFAGYSTNPSRFLQAMDVFFFPSKSEGLGLVALEAQATGLPVVMSDMVPKEVVVTENCYRLSLDSTLAEWAESLYKASNYERRDESQSVRNHGYDSVITTAELESIFIS